LPIDSALLLDKTMESARPEKAWRSLLFEADDVLSPQDPQSSISQSMSNNKTIYVGIIVLGASVRRIRVHAYKRVRNGKQEFVKAHWRQYWR
jgi:hypothetical protein